MSGGGSGVSGDNSGVGFSPGQDGGVVLSDPNNKNGPQSITPWADAPWTAAPGQKQMSQSDLVDQYFASPEGKAGLTGYSQEDQAAIIAALKGQSAVGQGGRVYANIGGQVKEITDFAGTIQAWQAGQQTAQNDFAAYAKAAQGQPGRDSTILTGAAVAPQTALAMGR